MRAIGFVRAALYLSGVAAIAAATVPLGVAKADPVNPVPEKCCVEGHTMTQSEMDATCPWTICDPQQNPCTGAAYAQSTWSDATCVTNVDFTCFRDATWVTVPHYLCDIVNCTIGMANGTRCTGASHISGPEYSKKIICAATGVKCDENGVPLPD